VRSRRENGSGVKRLIRIPVLVRTVGYYFLLFLLYRLVLRPYARDVLGRQLVGISGLLAVTASVAGYVILCCLPPFLWSRSGGHRHLSRGVESYLCYAAVFLLAGWLGSRMGGGDVPLGSGIVLRGGAAQGIASGIALFSAFILASLAGGMNARGRRRDGAGRRRVHRQA